jgi:hypothetical protein
MTITSQFAYFAPEIAECLEESFEQAGVPPKSIGTEHIDSALRSIRLILNSEWTTLGIRQWMVERLEQTMVSGDETFDLPTGGIDIFNAVLRRADRDSPMYRISRAEYLEIPDKAIVGRPDRYFVDRRYNVATVYLWQTPENSTDIMVLDYVRNISNPGEMVNTLQMPPHMLDAFVTGLAARLAFKFTPDRYGALQAMYRGDQPNSNSHIGGKLGAALSEDRDRSDVTMTIGLTRRSR